MPEKRIRSLDGLRGIAALIVVVYHSMLVTPSLWNQIIDQPVTNMFERAITYTPLRIVWAGGEAVWIFFILSGFVLVRPYLAGRKLSLRHYYPRRAIRLYLPFFGSVLLALALRHARPRPSPHQSGWILLQQLPTTFAETAKTLLLFQGDSTTLNSVWWSLRWEVWFSLLVPLVVIAARRFPKRAECVIFACLVIVALSNETATYLGHDNPLLYLPMFGIGAALAMAEGQLVAFLSRRRRATIAIAGLLAITAMTSTVAILTFLKHVDIHGGTAWTIAGPIGVSGATGLVALAIAAPGLAEQLARSWLVWIGERSYTLYLIHEPIVVSFAIAFGLTTMTWWWLPFTIGLSLFATWIMFALVEGPTLRLVARIPSGRPSPATVGATTSE